MSPEVTYILTTWDGVCMSKYAIRFKDRNNIPHDVRSYYLERDSREWFRIAANLDSDVVYVEEICGILEPISVEEQTDG